MSIKKKVISVIVALAMTVGLVSSSVFIAESIEHSCRGVECQVCTQVRSSLNSFNNLKQAPEDVLFTLCASWGIVLLLGLVENFTKAFTLVSLKTKLSN